MLKNLLKISLKFITSNAILILALFLLNYLGPAKQISAHEKKYHESEESYEQEQKLTDYNPNGVLPPPNLAAGEGDLPQIDRKPVAEDTSEEDDEITVEKLMLLVTISLLIFSSLGLVTTYFLKRRNQV